MKYLLFLICIMITACEIEQAESIDHKKTTSIPKDYQAHWNFIKFDSDDYIVLKRNNQIISVLLKDVIICGTTISDRQNALKEISNISDTDYEKISKASMNYLSNLLINAKLILKQEPTIQATCITSEIVSSQSDIGGLLLQKGYAISNPNNKNYTRIEAMAKSDKLGIWRNFYNEMKNINIDASVSVNVQNDSLNTKQTTALTNNYNMFHDESLYQAPPMIIESYNNVINWNISAKFLIDFKTNFNNVVDLEIHFKVITSEYYDEKYVDKSQELDEENVYITKELIKINMSSNSIQTIKSGTYNISSYPTELRGALLTGKLPEFCTLTVFLLNNKIFEKKFNLANNKVKSSIINSSGSLY